MEQSIQKLPTNGIYRINCHSSYSSWLAYLSSNTQIYIIQFTKDNKIKNNLKLQIPQQPVMFIKIYSINSIAYLLIGNITKLSLYKISNIQKLLVYSQRLILDRNIVYYNTGFISCILNQEHGIQFVSITRDANINIIPLDITKDKLIVQNKKIKGIQKVVSICKYKSIVYLGNQIGEIYSINLDNQKIINKFDTQSKYPIFHIYNLCNQRILVGTCQGQVMILSYSLESFVSVSIHHSLISRIHINNKNIYTFGEDSILHHLIYQNEQIKKVKTQILKKLPGLLFTINQKTYYTCYQNSIINDI